MSVRHACKSFAAIAAVIAVVCSASFASAASAHIQISINPKKPIVDQTVTVAFKTDRVLKPGFHWQAIVLGDDCGDAASFVEANSHRKTVKKGARLSFYLSPYNDLLNSGSDWCQGAASILVNTAPNSGTKGGKLIGTLDFRFYGKP